MARFHQCLFCDYTQVLLEKHHVPQKIKLLIFDHYSKFNLSVSSGHTASYRHQLEVVIITGCTISATVFTLAMNMLVKSSGPECWGPLSRTGTRQLPIRAFMGDIMVTITAVALGPKEREGHRQIPLQARRRPDSVDHRKNVKELLKGLQLQSEGHRFHQGEQLQP